MKTLLAALALMLALPSAAQAFDTETAALVGKYKSGKPVAGADVAALMRGSEKWCYDNQDSSCAWSEVYLDVTEDAVSFELANTWDDATAYAFTDQGAFKDDAICQTGYNWIDNLRAMRRSDDGIILGRALRDFKLAMAEARPDLETYDDCFDYLFVSSDAEQQVVTLRQRQYAGGVHDPLNDVEVTIHFDAEDAARLTLRL